MAFELKLRANESVHPMTGSQSLRFVDPILLYTLKPSKSLSFIVEILLWLNKYPNSKFIVGDGKQSIYRWRGSQVEQFIELINENNPFYIDKELINLPVNYRSNRKIIEFNNDFFNHIGSFVFRNNYFKNTYLEAPQEILDP